MKPSTQNPSTEPAVRVLKSATCLSLSGKSKLSYEIGCKDGSGILPRILANSASGSFSREWIDVHAIESALDKGPRGAPITSDVLRPLFRGTSSNNQLFCFAVLTCWRFPAMPAMLTMNRPTLIQRKWPAMGQMPKT